MIYRYHNHFSIHVADIIFIRKHYIHTSCCCVCLVEGELDSVHIIDFGNAIHYVHSEVSLYYKDFELQTPLYRAPEVSDHSDVLLIRPPSGPK